jgi:Transcription factor WhiB
MMRPADWRTQAACRGEDPDLFFPHSWTGPSLTQIQQAKTICARCPVADTCLTTALADEGGAQDRYGIRGGLTGPERYSLRRRKTRGTREPRGQYKPPAYSLADAVARRVTHTEDGHAHVDGAKHIHYQGRRYTTLQAAFMATHGRDPVGIVRRACGDGECALGEHLSDDVIREAEDRCGTRSGYLRHRARGEDCERCRRANSAADNRLRRTGTTKELAA